MRAFHISVFQWSLSHSKSTQVFRTLLSILAVLHNIVVRMVLIFLLISSSSSPLNRYFKDVPSAPVTHDIIITLMFHSLFSSLANSNYLSTFSLSFTFTQLSNRRASSTILFLLFITRSDLVTGIRSSVFIFKSLKIL